jgi:hypothetical protein
MLELKKGRRTQVIQRDVRGLELHVQELHVSVFLFVSNLLPFLHESSQHQELD